jgi:hypothetical protein
MKIRLLDDSIRLRLSRNEVSAASEQGLVECRTRFPDGSVFSYALEADANGSGTDARFASGRLVVRLPARDVAAWAGDETAVSLRGELTLPEGGSLQLLVEKDFRCLSPREGEDQSDLFQNPDSGT